MKKRKYNDFSLDNLKIEEKLTITRRFSIQGVKLFTNLKRIIDKFQLVQYGYRIRQVKAKFFYSDK